MDRTDNLWSRRVGNSKLSLSTNNDHNDSRDTSSRTASATRTRFGGGDSSHGGRNPFNAPLTTSGIASPSGAAAANFGLGTGAFASFGSANKTPKTPGTAFDWGKSGSTATASATAKDNGEKKTLNRTTSSTKTTSISRQQIKEEASVSRRSSTDGPKEHPLRYSWIIYYRPPTSKNMDYEESIKPMCRMVTVPDFWTVYVHCKRPSLLPHVSDYHFFREGIRPVWEDEANKKGGKWILRLKKGVADRYWEELLMAMVGDQFMEASDEVCGAVISVRAQEDVLSIWTKNDGGRNVKIRETVKRVLNLPADTIIIWKSHDDSISQRSAIDQARQTTDKPQRRVTLTSEEGTPAKDRNSASYDHRASETTDILSDWEDDDGETISLSLDGHEDDEVIHTPSTLAGESASGSTRSGPPGASTSYRDALVRRLSLS